jgi:hypothetical protein
MKSCYSPLRLYITCSQTEQNDATIVNKVGTMSTSWDTMYYVPAGCGETLFTSRNNVCPTLSGPLAR